MRNSAAQSPVTCMVGSGVRQTAHSQRRRPQGPQRHAATGLQVQRVSGLRHANQDTTKLFHQPEPPLLGCGGASLARGSAAEHRVASALHSPRRAAWRRSRSQRQPWRSSCATGRLPAQHGRTLCGRWRLGAGHGELVGLLRWSRTWRTSAPRPCRTSVIAALLGTSLRASAPRTRL